MLNRLIRFRNDLVALWHAFWNPLTPTYLKVITALTAIYVLSPADFLPDIIPVLGLVDDVLLVSLMVGWIVSRLPQKVATAAQNDWQSPNDPASGPTIDGTARRND